MNRKDPFNAYYFGFKEGQIELFAPTFKLKENSDAYNPKRTPAWCDRIIYRGAKRQETAAQGIISLVNYDSNTLVKISDHRPVFA